MNAISCKILYFLQAVRFVNKGKRLAPPPGCPQLIYDLMIQCWFVVARFACAKCIDSNYRKCIYIVTVLDSITCSYI